MKDSIIFYCFAALMVATLASCAGLKKKERPQYDFMDNLTSRYNIIFHGKSIIEEAEIQNKKSHRENYNVLLPVFIEPTESSAAAHTQLMDSVIEKSRRVINEKDEGKYIKDAYFLMGKANYLKGNYYNASEFFAYVAQTYTDQPKLRQPAFIWQARSLMQLGAMQEAAVALDSAFVGMSQHKRSRGHAYATRAKYHLLSGDQQSAITMLGRALTSKGNKSDKLRWHFLIGQLLEDQGQLDGAIAHYKKVARSNASYEMAFHASLNRAFLEAAVQADDNLQVRSLRRMLRDDKNKEFKDQILYYIAEAYYQTGDLESAIDFYNQSLAIGSSNRYQTSLTYLRLADHYFEAGEYHDAKHYYDSTAMFLPMDFPDASLVQRKITHMDDLINNLQDVARQDSLQYLANLNETDRNLIIDSLIQDQYQQLLVQAERSEKADQQNRVRNSRETTLSPFDQYLDPLVVDAYADNRFYFNNPDAIGMGVSAFRRKWGNRELTDNWRFSDMPGNDLIGSGNIIAGTETDIEDDLSLAKENQTGLDSVSFAEEIWNNYREQLPLDDEKLKASHQIIKNALQQVGSIYHYELEDEWAGIAIYEDLLSRYPEDEMVPAWRYTLVLLYSSIDNPEALANASANRDRLLQEYPDVIYTRILKDPDYLKNRAENRQKMIESYEDIYHLYAAGQFQEVITQTNLMLEQTEEDIDMSLAAQLSYLRTLSTGYTQPVSVFTNTLKKLVADYPDDNLVTPLSVQHLGFITTHQNEFSGRGIALLEVEREDTGFSRESTLLPWPELVIQTGPAPPRPQRILENITQPGLAADRNHAEPQRQASVVSQQIEQIVYAQIDPQDTYSRDMNLLPDSATYYFVINVMSARANLAPSRFGIGQFNRGRYAGVTISHQVKAVGNEAQLIYVGPFYSFEEVKRYENLILPLMPEIMKVPAEIFNTFVITESVFGTLSDFDKVDDYYLFYRDQ